LKREGRVGDSAHFGCGCWAQNGTSGDGDEDFSFGCSCTGKKKKGNWHSDSYRLGTGEQIIQSMFCRDLAQSVEEASDSSLAFSEALDSFLRNPCNWEREKAVGFIAVVGEQCTNELWFGHTTKTMGLGWMTSNNAKPKSFISWKDSEAAFKLSGHPIC